MFMNDKGVPAIPPRQAGAGAALVSHAQRRLAAALMDAYLMGSPIPFYPIAAVPAIGATSHGREL